MVGHEVRINLDEEDLEFLMKIKNFTGIKSNSEICRFALRNLVRTMKEFSQWSGIYRGGLTREDLDKVIKDKTEKP